MTVFEPLKTDVPNATVESWKVFVEAARGWAAALRGESREPIVTTYQANTAVHRLQ